MGQARCSHEVIQLYLLAIMGGSLKALGFSKIAKEILDEYCIILAIF